MKRPITYVKIRDFAYAAEDERHLGLGPDVPRANKVARLNRVLGTSRRMDSSGSWESISDDGNVDDDDDDGEGTDVFDGGMRMGMARISL